jgi:hypothetical protein
VHNIEYAPTTYTYTVTEQSEDGTQSAPLAKGNFTILQDQHITLPPLLTPVDLGNRVQILITLTFNESGSNKDMVQTIDYWVTK